MRTMDEELREQQEILEQALERRVERTLEFQWSLDPVGRLYGLARFSGNENASFWILPSGDAVVIH